ncbi:MAG: DUF72 domain-containing protein [Candidatus Marsarchaeota archaeon]|nr:DUF72 domain-containing protein [Candidatus Marsarchaeota archaeon]MCL5106341.1 DUF72 domain-containing protein [Candidatus Marsarchaeota archaeon]
MRYFVGTSGWYYGWNRGRSLQWYIDNSNLNAIELNSSFYRFPFPNQIEAWAKNYSKLAWVIKVNMLITHRHMLNENATPIFKDFLEKFRPLDKSIRLYLFQMPGRFSIKFSDRVKNFIRLFGAKKIAFEFRNTEWYGAGLGLLPRGIVIVSPDSPDMQKRIICSNRTVYLRFHGRKAWYSYKYKKAELKETADKVLGLNPKLIYAFFNNDRDMLENAMEFRRMLEG